MKNGFLGIVVATFWLAGLLTFALHVPALSLTKASPKNDEFGEPMATNNPQFMEDQLKTRDISKVARGLEGDHKYLQKLYDEMPPMKERTSNHLSERDLELFQTVYKTVTREFKEFRKNQVGEVPGVFQVFALVGMIDPFLENAKTRALVKAGIREEEFYWITARLMEAGAYCVEYKLNHDQLSDEEKQRLEFALDNMYRAAGLFDEVPDSDPVFNPAKWKPDQVPRNNIELYLRHSKEIHYVKVHIADLDFDQEAILEAAANNPP